MGATRVFNPQTTAVQASLAWHWFPGWFLLGLRFSGSAEAPCRSLSLSTGRRPPVRSPPPLSWLLEEVLSFWSVQLLIRLRVQRQLPSSSDAEPGTPLFILLLDSKKKSHGLVCKLYNGKVEFEVL